MPDDEFRYDAVKSFDAERLVNLSPVSSFVDVPNCCVKSVFQFSPGVFDSVTSRSVGIDAGVDGSARTMSPESVILFVLWLLEYSSSIEKSGRFFAVFRRNVRS